MTPAEWLAVLFLASFVLSTMWSIFEPDSLELKFNSNMRLVLAFVTQIAVIVLSLVVLAPSLPVIFAVSTIALIGVAIGAARS